MATSGFRLIDYASFQCDLDHTVGGKMRCKQSGVKCVVKCVTAQRAGQAGRAKDKPTEYLNIDRILIQFLLMIYNPEGMVNNRLGRARLHRRQPAENRSQTRTITVLGRA